MLSYMLPVEEKSPSVTAASAAAAARNLSLNLNNTKPNGGSPGAVLYPEGSKASKDLTLGTAASGGNNRPSSGGTNGKVIKSAIKTNHRYQLVSSSGSGLIEDSAGKKKFGKRIGDSTVGRPSNNRSEDLSDEHTRLLGDGDGGSAVSKSVKSDKNFNNLILVNGNVNGKLASVLKNSSLKNGGNGSGGGGGVIVGAGLVGNGVNGSYGAENGGPLKVAIATSHSHNGYSAVNNCEDDDDDDNNDDEEDGSGKPIREGFDLVASKNRKNSNQTINNGSGKMSTSASVTRNLNGINGNQQPQQQSSVETPSSGIIVDTSDADSEQTGGGGPGSADGSGGKKVKMNKLGGSKNVTLKRVSFGSSKGSMVETLVFETPTPLPEHAEREFFHSPAVLAGAGTTVNTVHHHHHHHFPHYHHHPQQQQDSSLVGLDDSGIELQEEVERSKVRVSFFQSSKPQSISPPESLLFGGGHNLIHFGGPGGGGGGGGGGGSLGYDNNNSLLDSSYISSAALNQQYDSLLAGNHHYLEQHPAFNPDDPGSMAAVMAYDQQQMSTESGWDNPFRPGGDLSREADEIVNLIKGGKPITPTGDQSLLNGSAPKDSSHQSVENGGSTVVDGVATKIDSTQLQSQPNGTKSPQKDGPTGGAGGVSPQKNGSAAATQPQTASSQQTQVSNQVIPGPQSASHVVIDEKKKKKCACCVIQ